MGLLRVSCSGAEETFCVGQVHSATRLLKHCSQQLALPLSLLGRRILDTGEWPDVWRSHWIVPIHKKKSVYDPSNDRGIHLTSQKLPNAC